MIPRFQCSRVRVYETVRTAHLERAAALPPASILYRTRRYDFDTAAAEGLDVVQAGALRSALALARATLAGGLRELEVNEPLMRPGLRRTALCVLAVRTADAVRGRRTLIGSYAIENKDPLVAAARVAAASGGIPAASGRFSPAAVRARLVLGLDRALAAFVASRLDRLVFGTHAAERLYGQVLGPRLVRVERVLIPALPAPAGAASPAGAVDEASASSPPSGKDPDLVVFLGAFEERKGFPLLARAWPLVAARRPQARLTVLGKGELAGLARELAVEHPSVRLEEDPPRVRITEVLSQARLLVLLSQPRPRWREQVGLPIVEGLSHGCAVLVTDETGLAEWLAAQGHGVLRPGSTPEEAADAVLALLAEAPSPEAVLASLPAEDGRLAADRWLFRR